MCARASFAARCGFGSTASPPPTPSGMAIPNVTSYLSRAIARSCSIVSRCNDGRRSSGRRRPCATNRSGGTRVVGQPRDRRSGVPHELPGCRVHVRSQARQPVRWAETGCRSRSASHVTFLFSHNVPRPGPRCHPVPALPPAMTATDGPATRPRRQNAGAGKPVGAGVRSSPVPREIASTGTPAAGGSTQASSGRSALPRSPLVKQLMHSIAVAGD